MNTAETAGSDFSRFLLIRRGARFFIKSRQTVYLAQLIQQRNCAKDANALVPDVTMNYGEIVPA